MFKISHYTNSFISIESDNSILTCDPWIGVTTDNAWHTYPIKNFIEIDKKIYNSDFIYISHLHCDHFDIKTLKKFKNKKLTFIIKKFDNGVLKKRLQKNFKNKIVEVEPFKKKKINKDFTVAIIPQIISNSSNLPDNIEYDLDTSILIQSNKCKTLFYNNVDNPTDLNVLKKINKFVKMNFKKKIDIYCCPLGAASEFPQCFLDLNKSKEKKRIINHSLSKIKIFLKFLKPKVFFPAGGNYLIYGKFHMLNKYIAQPTFQQIVLETKNIKTKVCNLIGGGSITFNKSKFFTNTNESINSIPSKEFIKKIANLKYYYSKTSAPIKLDLNNLDKKFFLARENYFKILSKKKNIKTKWSVNFNIYKNIELDKNCRIDKKKSKFLKNYNLKNFESSQRKIFKLNCYLEYNLFQSLISGKYPWNTSLTGSTIMYKRNPNMFNVDMVFSLNFLRV
jgi:hypothetical protein